MPKIALGSESLVKIKAVEEAFNRLCIGNVTVFRVKSSFKQNEQPVGFEEMYIGALMRAKTASRQVHDIAIGIENGIIRFNSGKGGITLDMSVIVVITKDGREFISTSSGLQLPEALVEETERRGFDRNTVGSVIAEAIGGDPKDTHLILTGGKMSRSAFITDGLLRALRQAIP